MRIRRSALLNAVKEPIAQRTFSIWFSVDDADSADAQMLFEVGGSVRGFNAFVLGGSLYAGAWDKHVDSGDNESWSGTWREVEGISSGTWNHLALVLNASKTPGSMRKRVLRAYLNGVEFDVRTSSGMQIYRHNNDGALGGVHGSTALPEGLSPVGLEGFIDDVAIWNRVLSRKEIRLLATGRE